jgi:hypothetical protein
MAYSEDHAQIFRDALSDLPGITEKKMFGGLCCMLNGNMLCGVHKGGGMARVGKDNEADALNCDGVDPLSFTGRPMGGMVDISEASIAHDGIRDVVLPLVKEFVGSLPQK